MGLEFFWVGGWLMLALLGYLIRQIFPPIYIFALSVGLYQIKGLTDCNSLKITMIIHFKIKKPCLLKMQKNYAHLYTVVSVLKR